MRNKGILYVQLDNDSTDVIFDDSLIPNWIKDIDDYDIDDYDIQGLNAFDSSIGISDGTKTLLDVVGIAGDFV